MSFAHLAVLCASALAAWTDVRRHRIPNPLSAALCVTGVILAAHEGAGALYTSVAILVVLLAAGTAVHATGLIGGGDVKFIAAACATLGMHDGAVFLCATLVAGGVLALIIAALAGRLRTTLLNIQALALPALAGVRPAPLTSGTKMPYALALLAGALTVSLIHT